MPGCPKCAERGKRPLSERPRGYVIAVVGGLLGGWIGVIASPLVLFGLVKFLKPSTNNPIPNRFLVWSIIGVIGVYPAFKASSITLDFISQNPTIQKLTSYN